MFPIQNPKTLNTIIYDRILLNAWKMEHLHIRQNDFNTERQRGKGASQQL